MKTVKIIQTARDTKDRLTEKGVFTLEKEKTQGAVLLLNIDNRYQKIVGFGGAFTESAAYTFYKMEPSKRAEILKKYFDPKEGIGYSIGRVHIHSCDFALGNYTYVEDDDKELKTFDISHEDQWTLPFIKAAIKAKGGDISLLASPWSPPAWMKTNKDMNNGGKLIPQYSEAWAKYYVKYIKAMREKKS